MDILDDIMTGKVRGGLSAEQETFAVILGSETIGQILRLNSDPLVAQRKNVKVKPLVGQRSSLSEP